MLQPTRHILPFLSTVVLLACNASNDRDGAPAATADLSSDSFGERLELDEPALAQRIAEAATAQVLSNQANDPNHVAKRDAHPKAHGCVTASFVVNDDLPADLRVGTFQPGKHYDAWVRFSNGSQTDDQKLDARGMAIKLLGVDGQRVLEGEDPSARTHDLVLTNHHTFFIENLSDYVGFMEAVTDKGNPVSFFISWNPFDWHLREAYLAYQFTSQPISSPLSSRYWSATPYALGNNVVKYSAVPCGGVDSSGEHANDPNYLRDALEEGSRESPRVSTS